MTISNDAMDAAQRLMDRCDELAAISEEPGMITRRFGTPAMREAMSRVRTWMEAAGMSVREDAIGNLIGHYPAGPASGETRRFVLGGHLDSVRDAGRYDGILGVLSGIAVVERLHTSGRKLPFPVEVAAFIEEEGMRFPSFIASRVYAGLLDTAQMAAIDPDGITMADAVRAYGGDPDRLAEASAGPGDLIGFIEAHIEQGPVLEGEGLPVGIVTSIVGSTRAAVTARGMAGHAGTVPMTMRRDALAAMAEIVLAIEQVARQTPDLVATVGQLDVRPGASNVISGVATATLDMRHADADVRERAYEALRTRGAEIAAARDVEVEWRRVSGYEATPCDGRLTRLLAGAVEESGIRPLEMTSGAGHDAISLARIAPVAMLFVRCEGGISHNPSEAIRTDDVAVAIRVLEGFLARVAAAQPGSER